MVWRRPLCITNVKTHTKHFCKKELWKDALGNKMNHERNDRAYRELILNINGMNTTLHGAFRMDKAPMTLLGHPRRQSIKVGNEGSWAEERLRGHDETLDVLEWLIELRSRPDLIECCQVEP
jgi:hypothetical protein